MSLKDMMKESVKYACTPPAPPEKKPINSMRNVLIIVAVLVVGASFFAKNSDIEVVKKPPETAYKSAQKLSYRSALLQEIPNETLLSFPGRMFQLYGGSEGMISTKKEFSDSYIGDQVHLEFGEKPQLVEDDIVQIMGRYVGTYKYKAVLGVENEIPSVKVDYFKVIKPKQ